MARTAAPRKPKVLLVDDHPDILRRVSRLLAFNFEVAAIATDGRQALAASARVEPDVIVMDIAMPGRNGFQTALDLEQSGSRAPIVFLTMYEAEEFVAEAFRSGGRGFVLKTRLHDDLVRALERVLSGQLFAPSLESLFVINSDPKGHAVQFHADAGAFVNGAASLVNKALGRGDSVSVISTGSIRAGLARRLQGYGWRVGESGEHGPYRAIDAAEAASAILRDGHPDVERVAEMVVALERSRLETTGAESRMTIVGDLAVQFFQSGNPDAVLELEHIWNDLTRLLPFLSVCCYPTDCFVDEAHRGLLPRLCAEHYAVVHSPDEGRRSSLR